MGILRLARIVAHCCPQENLHMLKKIVKLTVVITLTFFYSCNSQEESLSQIKDKGEIVVAMDVNMPGYFVLNGEGYGYQYDIMKAYADFLGVDLRVVSQSVPEPCAELIKGSDVDVVAMLSSKVDSKSRQMSIEAFKTTYVVLSRRGASSRIFSRAADFSLDKAMGGGKLMVSSGFKRSKNFDMLVDSLKETQIQLSSGSSFRLIERLIDGEYDYLICEKSEAQLGCAIYRNVTQVYEFAEKIPMSLVFGVKESSIKADFEKWLESYRNGEEYALLNELYFEKGIVGQLINHKSKSRIGGISAFDDVIKQVSAEQGHDWRFISAIAYSESRFNPYVVSSKGAKGLMQIMPIVARQFNVSQSEVMKPEVNVLLATKLLTKIERTLKLPKHTPYDDRMSIILACYNGGIGHVVDARNLAAKYGANPNSWADVSTYLKLKANPKYNSDDVVKCGSFRGSGQTLAFVSKVMVKYNTYCNNVKL